MSTMSLVAKLDLKGSEIANCYHYTFGRVGSPLSGGFYLRKNIDPPTALAIDIPDITKEKEGEKDAERKGY